MTPDLCIPSPSSGVPLPENDPMQPPVTCRRNASTKTGEPYSFPPPSELLLARKYLDPSPLLFSPHLFPVTPTNWTFPVQPPKFSQNSINPPATHAISKTPVKYKFTEKCFLGLEHCVFGLIPLLVIIYCLLLSH